MEETELSLASLGGRSLGGCDPVAGRMYAAVTPADAAAGADETWNRVRVVTAAAVGGGEVSAERGGQKGAGGRGDRKGRADGTGGRRTMGC